MVALSPGLGRAARFDPQPGPWRSFRVTTRLDLPSADTTSQAWIPLPSLDADWMRPEGDEWTGNAVSADIVTDPRYGARLLHATFAPGESHPHLEVTSSFSTRDRAADLAATGTSPALTEIERALYLAPTELMPTDGIVKETADRITVGAGSDLEKAQANL